LWAAIKENGHPNVDYVGQAQATVDFLLERVKPGDTVITLGAGSVYKIGEALLAELEKREEAK